MKKIIFLGLICVLGLPLRAEYQPASERMRVELSSRYLLYHDGKFACSNDFFYGEVFFSADFVNGTMTRAALGPWQSGYDPSLNTALTPEEMRGITLYRDAKGRLWLKKLTLSPRLFGWLLVNLDGELKGCPLTGLATSSVVQPTFEFETSGIDEGVLLSYSSSETHFSGQTSDHAAYTVEGFYLVQTIPNDVGPG